MSVFEALKRTVDLYSNCIVYADEGFVTSKNLITQTVSTGKFRTAFIRGRSFHFEWLSEESGKTLVFHSDSKSTLLTSSSGWADTSETLELGICSLFGATQSVAYVVPTLLLQSLVPTNTRVTDIKDPAVMHSDGTVIKIEGQFHRAPCELWLRRADGAVLRCITKTTATAAEHQSIIHEISGVLAEKDLPLPVAGEVSYIDDVTYEHVSMELKPDCFVNVPA